MVRAGRGALTASGQWGAVAVGTAAVVAGWGWAALLIGYFVTSTALTRLGRAAKAARAGSVLPDGTARTGTQVAANGALFAAGALGVALSARCGGGGTLAFAVAALGALAASAADTWATEIGLLWGGVPRSVITGRAVEPGSSGGVTLAGVGASVVAAALVAAAGAALLLPLGGGAPDGFLAVGTGGVLGSLADSILGATVQGKRQCEACGALTERAIHRCGGATRHASGLAWVTNDVVNLAATAVGAAGALAVASWAR